ncbi:MAG: hypothetical protein LAN71_05840 [Acidobacteriia bacterium]|nr:hypothetical protein [Terriglobia bacterium]
MSKLRGFAASVALLALLAGPVMACAMAQVPAGLERGACPGRMSHECESALAAASPSCCTISAQDDPYLAVRAELPAPVWTPDADGVFFSQALVEDEGSSILGNSGTFSPPSSPPPSISVLRI